MLYVKNCFGNEVLLKQLTRIEWQYFAHHFTGALRVWGELIMFLGIDNWFVTQCHEDLVLHTGYESAVAL